MRIKVTYYGLITDRIGLSTEEISIESRTILRPYFEEKYPELKKINYKIAINNEFSEVLPENFDSIEIALLPPFAGG